MRPRRIGEGPKRDPGYCRGIVGNGTISKKFRDRRSLRFRSIGITQFCPLVLPFVFLYHCENDFSFRHIVERDKTTREPWTLKTAAIAGHSEITIIVIRCRFRSAKITVGARARTCYIRIVVEIRYIRRRPIKTDGRRWLIRLGNFLRVNQSSPR